MVNHHECLDDQLSEIVSGSVCQISVQTDSDWFIMNRLITWRSGCLVIIVIHDDSSWIIVNHRESSWLRCCQRAVNNIKSQWSCMITRVHAWTRAITNEHEWTWMNRHEQAWTRVITTNWASKQYYWPMGSLILFRLIQTDSSWIGQLPGEVVV